MSVLTRPRLRRAALAAAAVVVSIPLLAQAASAHVAVYSPDAVRGGETAMLSFRVPNESPKAGTVAVRIDLPKDAPVAEVLAQPIAGWTVSSTERTLSTPVKIGDFTLTKVPSSVTWTAQKGTQIAPGEFQVFDLVLNPVPDVPTLTFAATQTYSDGKVVVWNEPEPTDGSEAEHPSPEISLAAETPSESPSASASESPSPTVSVSATSIASGDGASSTSDSTARWLAGAALVVAVACLVVLLVRRRAS
jgi:uncharacterized protein YcnI